MPILNTGQVCKYTIYFFFRKKKNIKNRKYLMM